MTASSAGAISGVLALDKPGGITSHAAVAEVARRLGVSHAGHGGTLDPMATGVLLVCLGEATKIAGLLLSDDKSYEGELELGRETDTLDAEGRITAERPAEAAAVEKSALAAAMAGLVGRSEQVPPMYSAVRRRGQRLHELARAGLEVEREPRDVTVHRFELLSHDPPRARFAVECSKGTYVRSLVADLGRSLGCGAHLTALRRTRSGGFAIDRAIPLADVTPAVLAAHLVAAAEALRHLVQVRLTPEQARAASTGKPLSWKDLSPEAPPSGAICLLDPGGRLLALVEVDGIRIRYRRVLQGTRSGPNP